MRSTISLLGRDNHSPFDMDPEPAIDSLINKYDYLVADSMHDAKKGTAVTDPPWWIMEG
jgi:hypothetical protein